MAIPCIDIGGPDDGAVLRALAGACETHGVFALQGHGVPLDLRLQTLAQMQAFFALPAARKRAIERTQANAWGYYDRELTKNRLDWKQILDVGPRIDEGPLAGNVPQWPDDLPGFRPVIEAFYAACETLCRRLLRLVVASLGMPPDAADAQFAPVHTSFLRLNYYPVCPDPAPPETPTGGEGRFAISHHTDSGAITVLLMDGRPGLQVEHRGRWEGVEAPRGELVVNIGDIVQVWSNDRYRAAMHRVVASATTERYSAPFFFNPSMDAVYAPFAAACSDANPARYRPIRWAEFRAARAAGDYADVGEEIQIGHFRTGG